MIVSAMAPTAWWEPRMQGMGRVNYQAGLVTRRKWLRVTRDSGCQRWAGDNKSLTFWKFSKLGFGHYPEMRPDTVMEIQRWNWKIFVIELESQTRLLIHVAFLFAFNNTRCLIKWQRARSLECSVVFERETSDAEWAEFGFWTWAPLTK